MLVDFAKPTDLCDHTWLHSHYLGENGVLRLDLNMNPLRVVPSEDLYLAALKHRSALSGLGDMMAFRYVFSGRDITSIMIEFYNLESSRTALHACKARGMSVSSFTPS